ncbi:uncharacterized protein PAE49_019863 isoform 1-T3 [Odontesthes bonariensis]|uniref:uncharacterized protein LOC142367854 n=1 Tax=Odontesthes bonariensis TaxID=219752 RepID=UPI003F58C74F
MEERRDESSRLDLSSAEKQEANDETREETDVGQDLQVASNSARKVPETEEPQRFGVTCPSRLDPEERNSDHRVQPSVAEDAAPDPDESRPRNDRTHPKREAVDDGDGATTSGSGEEKRYLAVLHQMLQLQQQKHKPGRRFKRKTLMKMAKLYVITSGWGGEENKQTDLAEELKSFTLSQRKTSSHEVGPKETFATQTSSKKRKTRETDCNSSTDLPDSLSVQSRFKPASEEQKEFREMSSEEPEMTEPLRNHAAGTSGIKQTPKQRRRRTIKGAGLNKKAKQKHSDETSADGQEADSEELAPREETVLKVKKKAGRRVSKNTLMSKEKQEARGMKAESRVSSPGNQRRKKTSEASGTLKDFRGLSWLRQSGDLEHKARRRRCKGSQQAAQQLPAGDVSPPAEASSAKSQPPTPRKPAPNTLTPAPNAQKLAPNTPNTQKLAPNTPNTPNTLKPALNAQKLAPNTQKLAPNTQKPAPNTQKPAPDAQKLAPNALKPAKNTLKPAPNTQKRTPNTKKREAAAAKAPVWDYSATASPETLMQTRDIQSHETKNSKRKKAAQKGKGAKTLHVTEESDTAVRWRAFSLKQEEGERAIMSVNAMRNCKGRGQRKRIKNEAAEPSLSVNVKTEPLDFPLMDLKTEAVSPPTLPPANRKRKYVGGASTEALSNEVADIGPAKQNRRRNKVKPELHMKNLQNSQTDECFRSKNHSGKDNSNMEGNTWKSANPENTTESKEKRKRLAVRGRRRPTAAGLQVTMGDGASGNVKGKKKRANKKQKMTSGGSWFDEAVGELPTEAATLRKKRGRRPKRELNMLTSPEAQAEFTGTGSTAEGNQRGSPRSSTDRTEDSPSSEVACRATTADLKPKEKGRKCGIIRRASKRKTSTAAEEPSKVRSKRKRREPVMSPEGAAYHLMDLRAIKQEPDESEASRVESGSWAETLRKKRGRRPKRELNMLTSPEGLAEFTGTGSTAEGNQRGSPRSSTGWTEDAPSSEVTRRATTADMKPEEKGRKCAIIRRASKRKTLTAAEGMPEPSKVRSKRKRREPMMDPEGAAYHLMDLRAIKQEPNESEASRVGSGPWAETLRKKRGRRPKRELNMLTSPEGLAEFTGTGSIAEGNQRGSPRSSTGWTEDAPSSEVTRRATTADMKPEEKGRKCAIIRRASKRKTLTAAEGMPEPSKVRSKRKRREPMMDPEGAAYHLMDLRAIKQEPNESEASRVGSGPWAETLRKKRGRRPKWELNMLTSPEAQTVFTETGSTAEGNQRGSPRSSTGWTEDAPSSEVACRATTADLKPEEKGRKCGIIRRASKRKTLTAAEEPSKIRSKRKRGEPMMDPEGAAYHLMHLRAIKQEPEESEASRVGSGPWALAEPQRKRRRRRKTLWTVKKKAKPPQIGSLWSTPADPGVWAPADENIALNSQGKRSLRCPFCSRCFRHISAFTLHKRIHTGEKPYRCLRCSKRFPDPKRLKLHSKLHREPPAASCPCCAETFKSKTELILHFQVHLKDADGSQRGSEGKGRSFRCSVCLREFSSKVAVRKHRRTHGVCGKTFSRSSGLSLHEKTHQPVKPFSCSACCKDFATLRELWTHSESQPGPTPFSCSDSQLRTHSEGQPGPTLFSCSDSELRTNSESHPGPTPFSCSDSELRTHSESHPGPTPFSCSDSELRTHSESQPGPTLFSCSDSELRTNSESHPGPTPFSCSDSELRTHSESHPGPTPFSCYRCDAAFSSSAALRSHQAAASHGEMEGFLVSQGAEAATATPVLFKCPVCGQLHRRWCHYILHLRCHTPGGRHRCEACGQRYERAADIRRHCSVCCKNSGEETECRGPPGDIWKEAEAPESEAEESVGPEVEQKGELFPLQEAGGHQVADIVEDFVSAPSPSSDFPAAPQPPTLRLQPINPRLGGSFLCGRCGKSFPRWNKLWLHQRLHRRPGRPFSCSRCELQFHFLGSYVHHLQRHATQTPKACPSCPDAFASEADLSSHLSDCHRQPEGWRCSTCGKLFSARRKLEKHKLLHKGAKSHTCLPCSLSFSCSSALTAHLQTHSRRLSVPRPAPLLEPLLFPYHCGRCAARFSSTDLLRAHQVCHFTAGEETESPPEAVASYVPNRGPEDAQGVTSTQPTQNQNRLPVSSKKHLFRYPHPDRLYVVPVVSSERPVVISDTEEEPEPGSPHSEPGSGGNSSNIPHTSAAPGSPHSEPGSLHSEPGSPHSEPGSGGNNSNIPHTSAAPDSPQSEPGSPHLEPYSEPGSGGNRSNIPHTSAAPDSPHSESGSGGNRSNITHTSAAPDSPNSEPGSDGNRSNITHTSAAPDYPNSEPGSGVPHTSAAPRSPNSEPGSDGNRSNITHTSAAPHSPNSEPGSDGNRSNITHTSAAPDYPNSEPGSGVHHTSAAPHSPNSEPGSDGNRSNITHTSAAPHSPNSEPGSDGNRSNITHTSAAPDYPNSEPGSGVPHTSAAPHSPNSEPGSGVPHTSAAPDSPHSEPGSPHSEPGSPQSEPGSGVNSSNISAALKHETGSSQQLDRLIKSLIPEKLSMDSSDCENDAAEPTLPPFHLLRDDVHSCVMCMNSFSDISRLREHYIDHARGLQ